MNEKYAMRVGVTMLFVRGFILRDMICERCDFNTVILF